MRAPERLETMAAHGQHDDLYDKSGYWSEAKEAASTWTFRRQHIGAMINKVCVRIQEFCGDGVFSAVGGEVWEASLLLCADMIHNAVDYEGSSALELGAGVGLPSFF